MNKWELVEYNSKTNTSTERLWVWSGWVVRTIIWPGTAHAGQLPVMHQVIDKDPEHQWELEDETT